MSMDNVDSLDVVWIVSAITIDCGTSGTNNRNVNNSL